MNEAAQIIRYARETTLKMYPVAPAYGHASVEAAGYYAMCYYANLLETKIHELLYRAPGLAVYDSMLPAKAAAMNRVGEVTP